MTVLCCVHDTDITLWQWRTFCCTHSLILVYTLYSILYTGECMIIFYFVHAEFKYVHQQCHLWPIDDLKQSPSSCVPSTSLTSLRNLFSRDGPLCRRSIGPLPSISELLCVNYFGIPAVPPGKRSVCLQSKGVCSNNIMPTWWTYISVKSLCKKNGPPAPLEDILSFRSPRGHSKGRCLRNMHSLLSARWRNAYLECFYCLFIFAYTYEQRFFFKHAGVDVDKHCKNSRVCVDEVDGT